MERMILAPRPATLSPWAETSCDKYWYGSSLYFEIGGSQEVVSDERGNYQFVRVVPGTSTVRGQMAGFRTVEQRNIASMPTRWRVLT
jgi:hypothetical protein